MKRYLILTFVCSVLVTLGFGSSNAQFPIKIPKIKIEKPKVEQPKTDSSRPAEISSSASTSSTYSSSVRKSQYDFVEPTASPLLITDSIYIQAATSSGQKQSWVPRVGFSLFYDWQVTRPQVIEYLNPDGSLWFSETIEGDRPGIPGIVPFRSNRDVTTKMLETRSTVATGLYGIKITDKSSGKMIFQGKFKVGKFPIQYSRETKNEYYVDHDWLMPIGTVSFHFSNFSGRNLGVNFPVQVSMWFKKSIGSTDHGLEARLFYKGQQIAVTNHLEAYEDRASDTGNLSADLHHWKRFQFEWFNEKVNIDNGGEYHRDNMPKSFFVDRNPGEYTVKVYQKGVQVREAKFTVAPDGRIADGGYQKPGYLTYHKVIIPVTVLPNAEKWNPTAWKTEAFYGNPMTGFTIP